MELRLAVVGDLPELKEIYREIVACMDRNEIRIWDEIYPCAFLGNDIEDGILYVLEGENKVIVGAFALCETNAGEAYVQWEKPAAKSAYIDRLGVNASYLKRGIGSALLTHAAKLAKQKNAEYLRLFVVDRNRPAINLYLKNNFTQAHGIYEEKIEDSYILYEYGFEKRV